MDIINYIIYMYFLSLKNIYLVSIDKYTLEVFVMIYWKIFIDICIVPIIFTVMRKYNII